MFKYYDDDDDTRYFLCLRAMYVRTYDSFWPGHAAGLHKTTLVVQLTISDDGL